MTISLIFECPQGIESPYTGQSPFGLNASMDLVLSFDADPSQDAPIAGIRIAWPLRTEPAMVQTDNPHFRVGCARRRQGGYRCIRGPSGSTSLRSTSTDRPCSRPKPGPVGRHNRGLPKEPRQKPHMPSSLGYHVAHPAGDRTETKRFGRMTNAPGGSVKQSAIIRSTPFQKMAEHKTLILKDGKSGEKVLLPLTSAPLLDLDFWLSLPASYDQTSPQAH